MASVIICTHCTVIRCKSIEIIVNNDCSERSKVYTRMNTRANVMSGWIMTRGQLCVVWSWNLCCKHQTWREAVFVAETNCKQVQYDIYLLLAHLFSTCHPRTIYGVTSSEASVDYYECDIIMFHSTYRTVHCVRFGLEVCCHINMQNDTTQWSDLPAGMERCFRHDVGTRKAPREQVLSTPT